MIGGALEKLPLGDIDLLFVENVGNLICPAEFALGAHKKVVISSISEGHDKPLKYPLMFHVADAVLVNKIDLAPYLNFDNEAFSQALKGMNREAKIFPISCTTGDGIERWTSWLLTQINRG
jgi:hydrogenase nickel incorporation protein HypB